MFKGPFENVHSMDHFDRFGSLCSLQNCPEIANISRQEENKQTSKKQNKHKNKNKHGQKKCSSDYACSIIKYARVVWKLPVISNQPKINLFFSCQPSGLK